MFAPPEDLYPGAQSRHGPAVPEVGAYVIAGQLVHDDAPAYVYLPEVQIWHIVDCEPAAYEPPLQFWQTALPPAPLELEKVPGWHVVHDVIPGVGDDLPGPQAAQSTVLRLYVPGAHGAGGLYSMTLSAPYPCVHPNDRAWASLDMASEAPQPVGGAVPALLMQLPYCSHWDVWLGLTYTEIPHCNPPTYPATTIDSGCE